MSYKTSVFQFGLWHSIAVSGQDYKRHLRYVQHIISNASKQAET